MSNEEIVTLYQAATDREAKAAALDLLYRQNKGLLHRVAARYAFKEPVEDMEQEAAIGLMMAADSYDASKGCAFSTHAVMVMQQHIFKYLHDHTGLVFRSENRERLILAYQSLSNAYQQRYQRRPCDGEIGACLGITQDAAREIRQEAEFNIVSLSAPIGDEGLVLGDMLPDPEDKIGQAEDELHNDETAALLWELVAKLEKPQRDVITAKYQRRIPVKQACREQGISYTTWKAREAKALRSLRECTRLCRFLDRHNEYQGTGLRKFKRTRTSAPEFAVLDMYKSKDVNEILRHYYADRCKL